MVKFVFALAAAGSALALASPGLGPILSAAPGLYGGQPYGNGGYNNGYGYNQNYGQTARSRALQVRINGIQAQIETSERPPHPQAQRGQGPAQGSAQPRSSGSIAPGAAASAMARCRISRSASPGWSSTSVTKRPTATAAARNGYNGAYGYNSYDRDRDGRDDRYEDDRGYDHD